MTAAGRAPGDPPRSAVLAQPVAEQPLGPVDETGVLFMVRAAGHLGEM
jgi:hypothetical protein